MRDLAFVLTFVAMLLPAIRFAHVGTMLWTWVALISPNFYMYGFALGLPFNKIVVAVGFLALFLDKNKRGLYFDSHIRMLTGFFIVSMISYTVGIGNPALADFVADRFFKTIILCFVIVATVRGRLQIHSIVIAICMGMGIHGALEAAKFISSGGGHILTGPATIGDNNSFGLAVLMVIPLLIYLYRYSAVSFVRLAFGGAILLNVIAVIATNSRGALVGLVAVAVAMYIRSRQKIALTIIFLVMAGIIAMLAPERWYGRMSTIDAANQDGSFMSRVASWKIHTLIALDRPLVGGGFSAAQDYGVFSEYVRSFSTLDFIPTPTPTIAFAAHSIYFEVLGDTGFIGFFLFLGMLFAAFRNLAIIRRLSRGRDDLTWAYDLADLCSLSLIAYAVSGAALSMAYFEMYYVVISLISVTRRHLEELTSATVPAGLAILQQAAGTGARYSGAGPLAGRPTPAGPRFSVGR